MEYVYVDNSNVFIEGRRVSAVKRGTTTDIRAAMARNITDPTYTIDFGKLHAFVAGSDDAQIARAALFGSRPPPNDSIWGFAERAGFEVILTDRNAANKEKKVDTGIVAAMMKDAYTIIDKSRDVITLVAGDGDFVPALEILMDDGFTVEVVFWEHASNELKRAATKFVSLDSQLAHIKL